MKCNNNEMRGYNRIAGDIVGICHTLIQKNPQLHEMKQSVPKMAVIQWNQNTYALFTRGRKCVFPQIFNDTVPHVSGVYTRRIWVVLKSVSKRYGYECTVVTVSDPFFLRLS